MRSRFRALVALLMTAAGLALAGCGPLYNVVGDGEYPSGYEEALAKTLDDSGIVVSHPVEEDFWRHGSLDNSPSPAAEVVLAPGTTPEQLSALMLALTQHDANGELPRFRFVPQGQETGDHRWLTDKPGLSISGPLANDAADGLAYVALHPSWRVEYSGARCDAYLKFDNADEAREVLSDPGSVWMREHVRMMTVYIEGLGDYSRLDSEGVAVSVDAVSIAERLAAMNLSLRGDNALAVNIDTAPDASGVELSVGARSKELWELEGADLQAKAEEVGLVDACRRIYDEANRVSVQPLASYECSYKETTLWEP